MAEAADAVIIGAGLAGLAAARHLTRAGRDVIVLEAGDDVGGRVRTDTVDGLLLDRGFQLYNPAYPEGRRVLDHSALGLRSFAAGVEVALAGRRDRLGDPRRLPSWLASSVRADVGSPVAKARFAAYAASRAARSPARLRAEPDIEAIEALRAAGADERLVDRLLRPFLSGVFLEDRLETSRRFLDLVLRSFVGGSPAIPSAGMGAIPRQIAASLPPGTVRVGVAAQSVSEGRVVTDDGPVEGGVVIVATDPPTAARLVPGLAVPEGRAVTTYYHVARTPPGLLTSGRPVLVVDGLRRGPLVNTTVLTHAAPTYAADGRVLVSSSALGSRDSADDERAAREHLALMYAVDTAAWEHVATYAIPYALPAMRVPLDVRKPVRVGDRLLVAGDHRDTASIQGALVSGRRAATAALDDLGGSA